MESWCCTQRDAQEKTDRRTNTVVIVTRVLLMGKELLENLRDAFILRTVTGNREEGQGHRCPSQAEGDSRSPG